MQEKQFCFWFALIAISFYVAHCCTNPKDFEMDESEETDAGIADTEQGDSDTWLDTSTETYDDSDSDTSEDTDIDAGEDDTDTYTEDTETECPGIVYLESCWVGSQKGEDCLSACDRLAGLPYHDSTCELAGDVENPGVCEDIIEMLGGDGTVVNMSVAPTHASIGCWANSFVYMTIYGGVDTIGCEPDTFHNDFHRVCACEL